MKIMLIDDDAGIRDAVEDIVSEEGYDFVWAGNASQAKALLRDSNPDLIVLDVMLPDVNGFDLCTKLRASHVEIPILFLSAKGDIVDKSIGFKAGGDDYLVKPFNPTELLLRIEALLRRTKKTETTCTQPRDGYLKIGNLEIFFDRYEVLKNGVTTGLSSKEFEIVSFMALKPESVFTREQILEHLWGESSMGDLNSVTVFVRRIREKIEDEPSKPRYLKTVWRVGYKFCSHPEETD